MGLEQSTLLGTVNNYGARVVGRAAGTTTAKGAARELVIQFTGQTLSDLLLINLAAPEGAAFNGKARLIVDEAFDLAATSVVEIGEDGAEATNGISLTEAQLESTGVKDVSAGLAGEWAATTKLPHYQTLGIAFSAGSVTDATVGKATLILEYDHVA